MTQVTATELAAFRKPIAGESAAYGRIREDLLAEEIELQRHIDRVSEKRRSLPDGPLIEKDYRFKDMNGDEVGLAELFGDHDTLITYFWMYGPDRDRPCPMCTNLLGPLDANADDVTQRVALAVLGRSTVERQLAFAEERGWRALNFVQTVGDDYALDFGGLDPESGAEWPVMAVFRKDGSGKDAAVRLFWKAEMTGAMADEGKDPRGGPDFSPLWSALDLTPEGRGDTWYPKLSY
ncbi:MAG: hypothetical protein QOJ91_800 [Sphingomonadales bacterium]|nr:hypothetical protein [Sphingomonadales bacterium]